MVNTFRSLANPNYRLWFCGAVISNIGGWLQRTAQDWLVIAELSDKNASAVGLVVFLQFAPQIFLLPITGWTADRMNRRKLLLITQTLMAFLALLLGLLVLSGNVALWQVCLCALGLGCVAAFDAPARHAFVSDLVSEKALSNAVGLNAVSFNSARLIGPAIAGVLIALVGSGWVFIINFVSFLPLLVALILMKPRLAITAESNMDRRPNLSNFLDGFRYIGRHGEMTVICIMSFLICCFGMNFSVYLSSMTVHVFEGQSDQYGLLLSMMAIGSITGAIVTASRKSSPSFYSMIYVAGFYALSCFAVALSPTFWSFAVLLICLGLGTQLFTTSTASFMQLATAKIYRGRVMSVVLAIAIGGTALGGPIMGFVADQFGARAAIALCGISGVLAVGIGACYYHRSANKPAK
ncbi:MFS transporter [Marinomonas sp. THO17]|uniref:MFS transporter n=1 Tax=Marinomonas sp. THO17 TaxID=3149048 RepID=UPI00336BFE85